MNFRGNYIVLIVCISISCVSFGQVEIFPSHFGQVSIIRNSLNPALQNIDSPNSFIFSNQFFTGAFSKIDNMLFLGSISLNKIDSANNKHYVGAKFLNEVEGECISRPKYYVSYSWHTKLSERFRLGAGCNVGRAAYIYKGTNVSSLGSDSNWDADFGLVLYSDRLVAAVSGNQLFNSKIIPKELTFRWKRFCSVYFQKTFDLSESTTFSVHFQNQFLPERKDFTDVGCQLTTNDLLLIGANIFIENNFTFLVGLKNIQLDKHHFSLLASYSFPNSNSVNANVQSYEMSVCYFIK